MSDVSRASLGRSKFRLVWTFGCQALKTCQCQKEDGSVRVTDLTLVMVAAAGPRHPALVYRPSSPTTAARRAVYGDRRWRGLGVHRTWQGWGGGEPMEETPSAVRGDAYGCKERQSEGNGHGCGEQTEQESSQRGDWQEGGQDGWEVDNRQGAGERPVHAGNAQPPQAMAWSLQGRTSLHCRPCCPDLRDGPARCVDSPFLKLCEQAHRAPAAANPNTDQM